MIGKQAEPQAQATQIPDAVDHYGRVFDPRAGEYPPQAQTVEPEVVAFRQWVEAGPKLHDYWMIANPDMKSRCLPQGNWEELTTLQSHREAMDNVKAHAEYQRKLLADWVQELITNIDKKDAALKSQNDALIAIYDRANAETMAQARAAIKRGQGALNDMG